METSGEFRIVVDPPAAVMLIPCCQLGIVKFWLMLPPLPPQPVSDDHAPPAPLVVRVVPPTVVKFTLSSQPNAFPNPLSPLASKTDCPCACICCSVWLKVDGGGLTPNEQLTDLQVLSVAMRFQIFAELPPR